MSGRPPSGFSPDPEATAQDFRRPGHIFPLVARPGGVLRRAGHTEATVDLLRLAGLTPVGSLIEVLKEDGTMARLPDLLAFAGRHGLKVGTIADLIRYRLEKGDLYVRREAEALLPTRFGEFRILGYRDTLTGEEHAALVMGSWKPEEPVLVRMHSECLTGDASTPCGATAASRGTWPCRGSPRRGRGSWST